MQPELLRDIDQRVLDTGDTMTGPLFFDNQEVFNAFIKERTIDEETYRISIGVGASGSLGMELWNMTISPDAYLSRINMYGDHIRFHSGDIGYTLLHSGNFQEFLDDTYVNIAGDTMSGKLVINSELQCNDIINSCVKILGNESVTSGTTSAIRNSLCIYGNTYGNDNGTYIKTAGKLSYGDPGPQIIFGTDNNLTNNQKLALIFTDNDTIGTGTSLSLVSTESNAWFIAPSIQALNYFVVKRFDDKPAKGVYLPIMYGQYQNGAGNYYNNAIINLVGTGNTEQTYNCCVSFGSTSGSTQITAGECGQTMALNLGLSDTENIYMTCDGQILQYVGCNNEGTSYTLAQTIAKAKITAHVPLYGAVWNDYAEYRESEIIEPGRVIIENGDDTLSLATKRLQSGAEIVSDTFGFAIGQTERANTPIAVSGRVLAYPYKERTEYRPGDAVCSAPNGTVDIMTEEEIQKYPHCIIGTVSAIPTYEVWGSGEVPVNGRIWIRIR